jgi:hypothetical protein
MERFDVENLHSVPRAAQLIEAIRDFASERGLHASQIAKHKVRRMFLALQAETKHEIAVEVSRQLPDLAPYLPRIRKPWMSEDYSMAIFEAALRGQFGRAHFVVFFCCNPTDVR